MGCRAAGIDLMVRILKTGYATPMRILECGVNGIMVPHCMEAAEARQMGGVDAFAPLGKRGFDGAGADANHMLVDPIKYMEQPIERHFWFFKSKIAKLSITSKRLQIPTAWICCLWALPI